MKNKMFICASMLCMVFCSSSQAGGLGKDFVDYNAVGTELKLEKLSSRQKKMLAKYNVEVSSDGGGYSQINRVVTVPGQKDKVVLSIFCNDGMSGGSCELEKIVSLGERERVMQLPDGESLTLELYDSTGTNAKTRFGIDERGLVSLVYIGNYVRSFKGKRLCDNKGAIFMFNGETFSLVQKDVKIPLGNECYVPSKAAQNDVTQKVKEYDLFFDSLFSKITSR